MRSRVDGIGRGPSSGDLVAGVTVALIAVPQSLAYAELAGLPPRAGLAAAALPAIAAAAFVSSRQLQTGPVALTALLTFGALSSVANPSDAGYIQLAALLALMVGLARLALGLARLGRVAFLLSEPVVAGFTTGAAILIISSQLPRALGIDPTDGGGVLVEAAGAIVAPDRWHSPSMGMAIAAGGIVIGGRRLHRLFPGVLVAVITTSIVGTLVDFDGAVIGPVDGSFPIPDLDLPYRAIPDLVVPAISIAVIGFAEPASIARRFAAEDRVRWDADRELVGQGVANLAAGLVSGFPVGGSFSRTSLSRRAGADSPWAGAVTGLVVLCALPAVTLLANLPRPVLSAIVIVAVFPLIDLRAVLGPIRRSPAQGMLGAATLAATLATAPRVERGVIIGVALSILIHLYREIGITIDSTRSGGRLVVSPRGVLWFATVPAVDRLIRDEIASEPDNPTPDEIVLDLGGVGRLDHTGGAALARLLDELDRSGIEIVVDPVPPGAARAAGIHFDRWLLNPDRANDDRPTAADRSAPETTGLEATGQEAPETREPGVTGPDRSS